MDEAVKRPVPKSEQLKAFEKHIKEVCGAEINMKKTDDRIQWGKEYVHFLGGWFAREARTDLSIEMYAKRFAGGRGGTDIH